MCGSLTDNPKIGVTSTLNAYDSFSLQTDNDRRRRISRLRRIQRGEDVSDDEYEASTNPADDAYLVRCYTHKLNLFHFPVKSSGPPRKDVYVLYCHDAIKRVSQRCPTSKDAFPRRNFKVP